MMMNNMFSMFDPSSSYVSTSWMITLLPLMFLKSKTFKKTTKMSSMSKLLMAFISKEIKQMMGKNVKFSQMLLLLLFIIILSWNLMAIFPYIFTPTAHISISFTLTTSLWASTMMFGWKNQFSNMMTHLTPLGTPNSLMNFMVIIETVSTIIRPVTLSIRISANMVAGHLLMSLLSSFSMANNSNMVTSLVPMFALIILEMGVALVQAYVLITLMLLYQNETS